jgi:RNA polymerase sigma-70 factor, ECF subfamily
MHIQTALSEEALGAQHSAAATDEIDLLDAAQSGDSDAFTKLCLRHSKPLLRRLHRLTKNAQDAEDSLQDAFLNAFRNLGTFQRRSAFSSWLTAIAINAGLIVLRKRRGDAISLDDQSDSLHGISLESAQHHGLSPEAHYERHELHIQLSEAIRSLPAVLRRVTELRVHDMSIGEIAGYLGISESSVKSRLVRARAALRRSIAVRRSEAVRNKEWKMQSM